jgi:hypothetical protein
MGTSLISEMTNIVLVMIHVSRLHGAIERRKRNTNCLQFWMNFWGFARSLSSSKSQEKTSGHTQSSSHTCSTFKKQVTIAEEEKKEKLCWGDESF